MDYQIDDTEQTQVKKQDEPSKTVYTAVDDSYTVNVFICCLVIVLFSSEDLVHIVPLMSTYYCEDMMRQRFAPCHFVMNMILQRLEAVLLFDCTAIGYEKESVMN